MNAWLLCVLIDYKSSVPADFPANCTVEPSEADCRLKLIEWVDSAWEWERRSQSRNHAMATCEPQEVST